MFQRKRLGSRYHWGAIVALIGFVLIAGSTQEGVHSKPGRMVRVERPTQRQTIKPRACMFMQTIHSSQTQMTCVGANDFTIGERFSILGEDGSHSRLTVEEVSPSAIDACNLGFTFDVKVRIFDRLPGANPTFSQRFAVRGLEIIPGISRIIPSRKIKNSPSGNSKDNVIIAVDRDGDTRSDFMVVLSACPEVERELPWVTPGRQVTSHCLDYWERSGTRWWRSNREPFYFCQ